MKISSISYIGGALLLAATLAGCQDDFDAPGMQTPEATWQANTTIADLKAAMWKDDTNYAILCPEKNEQTKEHYIIKGRVISSDATGNVYKSMYIQDATGAITLSINQNSLYNQYRIGQEVVIDVTGLYVGKYAGLEQIGGYGEYNGTPQVSFMIYPKFTSHCQLNGLPDDKMQYINYGEQAPVEGLYCTVMKINQLPTDNAGIRAIQSQLVEFRNVHFEEGGENTYSTYQTTENRNLVDESGNTIVVRTSGYSNFYNQTLPKGTGTVRALLSYFNGTWQLILRSTADVMFGDKGQKEDPYTVDECIAKQGTGTTGWVKGYIVGSLKGNTTTVTSNDDIIWSKDAELDNNIVIGETADTRDFTRCVVVALPAGSDFRKAANLIDNPGVYGNAVSCRGTFEPQLGMAGVTGNSGTAEEFTLEGGIVTPPVNPNPDLGDPIMLNVADATNFRGTHNPEEPKTETSNGRAENWQPLEGLTIGDFTFSFTYGASAKTLPAWYNVMSTATGGTPTLRFYADNQMTIIAPSGSQLGEIVMNGSNANNSLQPTANTGTCTRDGNTVTWKGAGAQSVTISFNATYRVSSFTIRPVK